MENGIRHLNTSQLLLLLFLLLFVILIIGTLGFHHICKLSHMDAFYNSCLTVTTLGIQYRPNKNSEKIWISIYSLISVILFLSIIVYFLYKIIKMNIYDLM
jgi:hypothetical protein